MDYTKVESVTITEIPLKSTWTRADFQSDEQWHDFIKRVTEDQEIAIEELSSTIGSDEEMEVKVDIKYNDGSGSSIVPEYQVKPKDNSDYNIRNDRRMDDPTGGRDSLGWL